MTHPLRWDGHTHCQLCPHGSGDATAEMIQKAISSGFERYSITEHAPLPVGVIADQRLFDELALKPHQMKDYLSHVAELKAQFAGQIEILLGLEIDYLPGWEDYTRDLLAEYGPLLEDALFSMHKMPGLGGLRCLDVSPEDFEQGLVKHYGSVDQVHQAYWGWIESMVDTDFGPYKPKRIGHLGLIRKFVKAYPPSPGYPQPELVQRVLGKIKKAGMSLDYNVSGHIRPLCQEAYINDQLLPLVKSIGIPMVYGSDSHGVAAVGERFSQFLSL